VRINLEKFFLGLAVILILIWTLSPIYWIVNVSLKVGLEVYNIYSLNFSLSNYVKLFEEDFTRYLVNTIYLATLTTLISLILSVPASYAIARLRTSEVFKKGFLAWTLFARTIPPIVLILPIYVMFSQLKLLDNLNIVALTYQIYTLPFSLWTLIGFFREAPKEIEEAALIDGADPIRILIEIMLPVVMPGIVATAIFCLLMSWNEFLYAVILLQSLKNYTVPLVIASYISEWGVKWGEMAAAGIISSLPMLLFTGYVQKYLVLGFMRK
jgi:multiple sugar transport system permease protein